MKKFIFISIVFFIALSLEASVYKGHKVFKKQCLECHGKAMEFVIAKTSKEWEEILANEGDSLYDLHKGDRRAMSYFNGDRYKKNIRHLRDFFFEYAADTGEIPACD